MHRTRYLTYAIVLIVLGIFGVLAVAVASNPMGVRGVCPMCGSFFDDLGGDDNGDDVNGDDANGATGGRGRGMMSPEGIEAAFIEEMIPHHQDAVDMSELALERAEHAELRDLAGTIADTQRAEIRQMEAWYDAKFGRSVPDDGSTGRGPMMGPHTDMQALEDATDFDKEFIEQMVPHHRQAIMMAQMLYNTSDDTEMRALARTIIDTQSAEIDKMVSWYEAWYGR